MFEPNLLLLSLKIYVAHCTLEKEHFKDIITMPELA